jgi:hypothetical protein
MAAAAAASMTRRNLRFSLSSVFWARGGERGDHAEGWAARN